MITHSRESRPRIPAELYRSIFEDGALTKTDLCVLAQTSRQAQAEAERLIYRHLEARQEEKVIALCRHICAVARFGPLIRSLHIRLWEYRFYILHSYHTLIAATLYRTENLVSLIIDDSSLLMSILLNCRTYRQWQFKLRSFGTMFLAPLMFDLFLRNQPSIRRLSISHTAISQIPINILPQLSILKWSLYGFAFLPSLFSDRNIIHVSTGRPSSITDEASRSITALECQYITPSLLQRLPRLKVLSVQYIVQEMGEVS
jgi:hypothetical protein